MSRRRLALLRGINVGGRNIITMADLRKAFEDDGHGGVRTYIQSGNVVFDIGLDAPTDRAGLETHLERMLSERVGKQLLVVVLDVDGLQAVIDRAPRGFGEDPDGWKYDVMFLKPPLTAAQVMDVLEPREGVDIATPGEGAVYFQRDATQLTKSRMSKVVSKPEYQRMTVRNWRTTTRLLEMLRD